MLTLAQRLKRPEVAVEELIYQHARMHRGAIPGVIQDVSTSPNVYGSTVNVDISLNETLIDINGNPMPMKIPTLPQVKLAQLGAGGFFITLPVAVGDECMLIFQDVCLDAAWQNGGINNPELDKRRHDLSDAICLPLRWTQKNALSNVSNTSMQIRSLDSTTYIDITAGQITIKAAAVAVEGATTDTPLALLNSAFYTWFTTVYMPSVDYVTVAPMLPTGPLTTHLKAT
jgi:hypothetical protein